MVHFLFKVLQMTLNEQNLLKYFILVNQISVIDLIFILLNIPFLAKNSVKSK